MRATRSGSDQICGIRFTVEEGSSSWCACDYARARALVPPVMTVVYPYYVYPCIMYLYFVKVDAKL